LPLISERIWMTAIYSGYLFRFNFLVLVNHRPMVLVCPPGYQVNPSQYICDLTFRQLRAINHHSFWDMDNEIIIFNDRLEDSLSL
jgi:hypothetical protein